MSLHEGHWQGRTPSKSGLRLRARTCGSRRHDPASTIWRTMAGNRSASWPIRKKVAGTPSSDKRCNNRGVYSGCGPSSKVRQTAPQLGRSMRHEQPPWERRPHTFSDDSSQERRTSRSSDRKQTIHDGGLWIRTQQPGKLRWEFSEFEATIPQIPTRSRTEARFPVGRANPSERAPVRWPRRGLQDPREERGCCTFHLRFRRSPRHRWPRTESRRPATLAGRSAVLRTGSAARSDRRRDTSRAVHRGVWGRRT